MAVGGSSQEFAHFGRNGFAIGASGELLGGESHHASHVLHACGASLGDDVAQGGGEFLVGERLGQELVDDGGLCQFFLRQVGAVLLGVNLCALTALLGHAHERFERILVAHLATIAGLRLDEQQFGLDALQGGEPHLVAGQHGCLDARIHLFEYCHDI